ncbi:MAG TPA: 50S ribosomal protein L11 methyltransferase, partial [Kiloniellaceae bacterium]|nr:50S ribosomal protein L11 methyltransferase [Kiloniellaceae bacterium]
AAVAGIAAPDVVVAALPETDWVAESQKGLPALRAGRFFLYGSHFEGALPSDAIALLVEANAAFGTGRHESTKGCLLALSALAKRRRFHRVLDMGCGSGVLAMAAARLWPCRVLAVDNDPVAVKVARVNAALNGVARQVATARSEGYRAAEVAAAGPYDLILANILAEPLNAMARDLQCHLAAGGLAVLSGLLDSQARQVRLRHRAQGLRLCRRIRLGDWTTLILQRPR